MRLQNQTFCSDTCPSVVLTPVIDTHTPEKHEQGDTTLCETAATLTAKMRIWGTESCACLGHQGKPASEVKQPHLCDVQAVNVDGPGGWLNNSEESLQPQPSPKIKGQGKENTEASCSGGFVKACLPASNLICISISNFKIKFQILKFK